MSAQTSSFTNPNLVQAGGRRALARNLVRFAHYFLTSLDVARQRRQLLALNERTLKDIGKSQADALREADRGFWDIPENLKPRP